MTALDTRFRALAERLMADYGTDATLVTTQRVYDEVAGEALVQGTTNNAVKVSPPAADYQVVDGNRVRTNNLRVYVAATAFNNAPTTQDKMQFNNTTYAVLEVHATWSGEQVAMYELVLGT